MTAQIWTTRPCAWKVRVGKPEKQPARTDPRRIRDREAPGSNPGPPTNFEFKSGDSGGCPELPDHRRVTDSPRNSRKRGRCGGSRLPIGPHVAAIGGRAEGSCLRTQLFM